MAQTIGSLDLNAFSDLYSDSTQYFWFESDATATYGAGAHVTLVPDTSFMSNPTGQNILMNTDGFSIRNGLLPMMTLDNDSLDFNVIDTTTGTYTTTATFTATGAQIGQTNGGHSIIDVNGMRVYGGYNNVLIAHIGFTNSYMRYYTFGERKDNSTIGNYSHAVGRDVVASGAYSHAEGYDTAATNTCAHAEGNYTSATGYGSHAEGFTNFTTSERTDGIVANNYGAHAEGYAANNPSYNIKATGLGAHAEGNAAIGDTIASGDGSHVEGSGTKASGTYSHAQNKGTEVAYEAQTALGQYNSNQSTNALEIGNGTSDSARSNALTVDWDGDVCLALDTTAASGTTDGDLYAAITALGWESDVIV